MLTYADVCAPQPAHAPALAKPVAAIFNADEEEDEKERERAMRKKMKLERIDYGEHALDVDKKVFVLIFLFFILFFCKMNLERVDHNTRSTLINGVFSLSLSLVC